MRRAVDPTKIAFIVLRNLGDDDWSAIAEDAEGRERYSVVRHGRDRAFNALLRGVGLRRASFKVAWQQGDRKAVYDRKLTASVLATDGARRRR